VTVTGLLGGRDILDAVSARRPERVYLPSVTLRDAGDLFLDGLSRRDFETESGSRVQVFPASPRGFFETVYNGETPLI